MTDTTPHRVPQRRDILASTIVYSLSPAGVMTGPARVYPRCRWCLD
jgi:hypothetical protein